MPSLTPVIVVLMFLVAILAIVFGFVPVIRRLRARRISTFQSTVLDKKKETTMIYTGVFIPLVIYYLRVKESLSYSTKERQGILLQVSHAVYRSIDIGDTVSISKYSDGSYRLD